LLYYEHKVTIRKRQRINNVVRLQEDGHHKSIGHAMNMHHLLAEIMQHKHEILRQGTPYAIELLKKLIAIHPADLAQFIETLDREDASGFFLLFPRDTQYRIFDEISQSLKVDLLESLTDTERSTFLNHLSIDDLTDFFEDLSDDELKHYLRLLHRKDRDRVLSLLKFDPETAGGIMYTDVLTLMQDFTVEKSIHILQRLRPSRALHHTIYVTSQNNEVVGHINLEDLVLKGPKTRIGSFVRANELVVNVYEDQQDVAHKMLHYGVSNAPVIDNNGTFLGVIPSQALVEVIEEEASEDIYRMSALTPSEDPYFARSFAKLLYQRSSILMVLLLVQTFSTIILRQYNVLLEGFLFIFYGMVISTGGNASSQTSALAIQGMASGDIDIDSSARFVRRELMMGLILGTMLGIFSFVRMYAMHHFFNEPFNVVGSIAVSCSLMAIVFFAILLGSTMPFILKRLGIDPAHSAGPILTTVIDVIGVLLYCIIGGFILHYWG
jgi:magnesium transporter